MKNRNFHLKFVRSLEIVKDCLTPKNIRTGISDAYRENYDKIDWNDRKGVPGDRLPSGSGTYKLDPKTKKWIKVSDKIPNCKIPTL